MSLHDLNPEGHTTISLPRLRGPIDEVTRATFQRIRALGDGTPKPNRLGGRAPISDARWHELRLALRDRRDGAWRLTGNDQLHRGLIQTVRDTQLALQPSTGWNRPLRVSLTVTLPKRADRVGGRLADRMRQRGGLSWVIEPWQGAPTNLSVNSGWSWDDSRLWTGLAGLMRDLSTVGADPTGWDIELELAVGSPQDEAFIDGWRRVEGLRAWSEDLQARLLPPGTAPEYAGPKFMYPSFAPELRESTTSGSDTWTFVLPATLDTRLLQRMTMVRTGMAAYCADPTLPIPFPAYRTGTHAAMRARDTELRQLRVFADLCIWPPLNWIALYDQFIVGSWCQSPGPNGR